MNTRFTHLRLVILMFAVLLVLLTLVNWNESLDRTKTQSVRRNETAIIKPNISTLLTELSNSDQTQKISDRLTLMSSTDITWQTTFEYDSLKSTEMFTTKPLYRRKSHNRVVFLKVHKAGSTTAQNIFLRYGETRNLTFVLANPRKGMWDNVIGLQTTLDENNTLPPPQNKTFDILCCHVLYNREAFQKFMPTDTAYIGIVREPFEQFLSTINYFGIKHFYDKIVGDNKVLGYLQNPQKYENMIPPHWSMTNNRMAIEFGFPPHLFRNYSKEDSQTYLEKLGKEFDFVIVLEYFPESVILMRRMLGWTIKDVLYFKKNEARRDYFFVDNTHRYLHERFARLDYDLYDFFHKKLWESIQKEGPDFQSELLYFNRLRKEIEDYCRHSSDSIRYYPVKTSMWTEAFNVSRLDCKHFQMNERIFISKIRKRQYGSQSTA